MRVLQALVRPGERRYPAEEYQGGNMGLRRQGGKSLPKDRAEKARRHDLQGFRLQGVRKMQQISESGHKGFEMRCAG